MKKEKLNQAQLPYERFLRFGPESLTEAELLAIILRTGTREKSALQLAEEVLKLFRYPNDGLDGLYRVTLEELLGIKGIGEVKAVKLKCLAELSLRISQAAAQKGICFTKSGQVAAYFMERMRHKDTECTLLLCLDSKGQLLKESKMSEGSVRMALISAREIFMEALEWKAVNIILLHNHPSGDPNPSQSDIRVTLDIREMGDKMNIPLLDHIIIGDKSYISFMENDWFSLNTKEH